ncbi:MAG TPA: hypothetical protein VF813_01860, partial [Anaerolineaceae bacterium]
MAVGEYATLALALTAGLSMMIYALLFARIAYLPEYYWQPLATGKEVSLRLLDGGHGLVRAELILSFIALGVLYYMGWKAAHYARGWLAWAVVLAGGLAFGLALLFMYPFGAADIADNILHARIFVVYNGNPFINLIHSFPKDPFFVYTAWKDAPSAYGPLWELAAGLATKLAGNGIEANLIAFKALPGLFYLLSLPVAALMLRRVTARPALPALLLLAWNPLVLYEVWGNGHNDIMMAFFILLAGWMVLEKH